MRLKGKVHGHLHPVLLLPFPLPMLLSPSRVSSVNGHLTLHVISPTIGLNYGGQERTMEKERC